MPDERPEEIRSTLSLLRLVASYDRARFAKALAVLLAAGLAEGFSILLIIPLLSLGGADGAARLHLPFGPAGAVSIGLPPLLAAMVVLVCLQALFTRYKNIYLADLLFGLLNRVRLDLFAAIGRLRWDHVSRQRSADLHHLLTTDVERVYTAAFAMMTLLQTLLLLAVYLVVSCLVSPLMTLLSAMLGLAMLVLLAPLRGRATRFGITRTVNKRNQYRTVSEFLAGLKTAKIHNAEQSYLQRLDRNLALVREEAVGFMRLSSTGAVASQAASAVAVAVVIYAGIAVLAMPVAGLVAFLLILMRISPRFLGLQTSLQDILANVTVLRTIEQIRKDFAGHEETEQAVQSGRLAAGAVRFENVGYSHGDRPALEEVSLVIPERRITAVIGPSGSGKSTFADLLAGLIVPQRGRIMIGGAALEPATTRQWRDHVAYMPQEPFLFHDTIADNMRFAVPSASDADIWRALDAADAAGFVSELPDGLGTVTGQGGSFLSGGQRQRIALARALLSRPRLLILDEVTSALDWESQASITRSLARLKGQITIVMIAHRPSLVANADWVVAFDRGAIAQMGPFAELAGRPGVLSRLLSSESDRPPPAAAEGVFNRILT
ncbi:MAG TPA: ABC transporter ATP-binding protein [Novosphingobium sp.]|nr:ABC transporter ATP-binding protein [Novosphingobium sp.]